MQTLILLAAWSAVVVFVVMVGTRPWKSPAARAPLPLALAAVGAAWVLAAGIVSYRHLMADGAWTGATIAMAFVPGKAIIFSMLAYAVGRTFLTARAASDPPA